MRSKEMRNVCLNSELDTPTICNTHLESRKCICRFTDHQAYHGTNIVSCDRIFDIDDETKNHPSLYGTAIYKENYYGSPEAFDEMILSDLESFLRFESGTLVMLRKFCRNKQLHVQFVQLKNSSRDPIFFKEDLVPTRWNHAVFNKHQKLRNGVLADNQEWLPLIPIVQKSDNLPFDATVFTVSWIAYK